MGKAKQTWKFFSWNTLCIIMASCLLNAGIWIALHGIPLAGLPQKASVQSVTVTCNGTEERKITDEKDIELLVKSANLLNYRLWGKAEGSPVIGITYHLENGSDLHIQANNTTLWWHGKSHALKETDTFVNIIQGLFFN